MAKIIKSITLTDHQKSALAKIVNAPTPKVAGEDISKGSKMVSARNVLVRLGLVIFQNGEATATSKGTEVMTDENIIDDSGSLTDIGTILAAKEAVQESLIKEINNT